MKSHDPPSVCIAILGVVFTFHIHAAPADDILKELAAIRSTLAKHGVLLMAVSPQIAAFSARVDAATNKIAADLQALRDKIAAGTPLTPEDVASLDSAAARLELMGRNPDDPTPDA